MKKGSLDVRGQSELSSDIVQILDEGIMFGSGTAIDDFACVIAGGASLSLTEGTLVYNNTDPNLLILDSVASVFSIAANARLVLDESLQLARGGIEFGNQASFMRKQGKSFTGSIFPLGVLNRQIIQ